MVRSLASGVASLAVFVSACSESPSHPSEAPSPQPVQASGASPGAGAALDPTREGTLVNLAGRHGTPGSLFILASYKVKREAGKLTKTLGLEIEDAKPGETHALSLDGFKLAKLVTNAKGEVEYELTAENDDSFPDGFKEPGEGSLLRVGELAEIRLLTLHKVTDLQVEIAGPGKLTGKVGYKVERLGEAVTTEFQVKVAGAGAKAVHPVKIDGVHVGDLSVDPAGKGKLVYSTLLGKAFPPGFQAPRAGAKIVLGTLYEGELRDDLGPAQ